MMVQCPHTGNLVDCLLLRKADFRRTRRSYCLDPVRFTLRKITVLYQFCANRHRLIGRIRLNRRICAAAELYNTDVIYLDCRCGRLLTCDLTHRY